MCSLELYNWYENRFPNDFKQLIQIKHYNISDLSFLLSKTWYKLDYGEKLLMCAVYYDDLNLAKQMLNEKQFKVNPFYGKHYQVNSASRHCSSNTGSINNVNQLNDINDITNVFTIDPLNSLDINFETISSNNPNNNNNKLTNRCNRRRRHSLSKDEIKCWCKNDSYLSRASLSNSVHSSPININMLSSLSSSSSSSSSSESIDNTLFSQQETDFDMFNHSSQQPIMNSQQTSTNYFLNHSLCELSMQTPFYFAIKLNNIRMCQLFLDNLKKVFLLTYNGKLVKNLNLMNCYQNHRNYSTSSSSSIKSSASKSVYLNSLLSNSELTKLLMISLSNRNYELAILILSNVQNPKQILYFQHFSESFIYNEKFCLYLLKNKIVDIKVLLKEATTRHATSTTYYLVNYLEQLNEKQLSQTSLFNVFKCVITNSILIGDVNIFKMLMCKLEKHLNTKMELHMIFPNLSVKNLLQNNYQKILDRLKSSNLNDMNKIDIEMTKKMAKTKGLDTNSYFQTEIIDNNCVSIIQTNKLSYFNRFKLFKFLFIFDNNNNSNESFEQLFSNIWSDLEIKTKRKLTNYDKIFAANEYKEEEEDDENKYNENQTYLNVKRFYLGRYLVYAESEPFLVRSLLDSFNDTYAITHSDLIQAAKSEISELSIYYLLNHLKSFNSCDYLLEPEDDLYGNFLEILFCRMVKCQDHEKELRLRLLFFEAIILKNAKMTCSTNLLNLFVTNSQYVNKRLLNIYFPCLFYLTNTFLQFKNQYHKQRFQILLNWFVKTCLFDELTDVMASYLNNLNDKQTELILFEYYSKKILNRKFSLNFDFTLQELARNAFMKLYSSRANGPNFEFLDAICDSARHFIFYFNEIKSLLLF